MSAFLLYPIYLFIFWYKDVLVGLFNFYAVFNKYVAQLLSLPLLVKTFFKPLKNEYRQGLVVFSIVSGIVIKSVLISIDLLVLLLLLSIEMFSLLIVALFPLILLMLIISPRPLSI